jgi:hypothetical protein
MFWILGTWRSSWELPQVYPTTSRRNGYNNVKISQVIEKFNNLINAYLVLSQLLGSGGTYVGSSISGITVGGGSVVLGGCLSNGGLVLGGYLPPRPFGMFLTQPGGPPYPAKDAQRRLDETVFLEQQIKALIDAIRLTKTAESIPHLRTVARETIERMRDRKYEEELKRLGLTTPNGSPPESRIS